MFSFLNIPDVACLRQCHDHGDTGNKSNDKTGSVHDERFMEFELVVEFGSGDELECLNRFLSSSDEPSFIAIGGYTPVYTSI